MGGLLIPGPRSGVTVGGVVRLGVSCQVLTVKRVNFQWSVPPFSSRYSLVIATLVLSLGYDNIDNIKHILVFYKEIKHIF